jgi:L-fuconolactonase
MPSRSIDAHVHFWRLARGDYDWMTPDLVALYRDFQPTDLAPQLEKAGIGEAVLVQAAATLDETRFILDLAAHSDFISGVVGWVDMASPMAAHNLDRLGENPWFKGVRPMIHDIPRTTWMLEDALKPAFDKIEEMGLAFDCLVRPAHLKPLLTLLSRRPGLRALIDHGGKPDIAGGRFDDWAGDMKRLARETGVLCKFSGLVTEAGPDWSVEKLRPYADHLIDCFGPDRLVFGSDWPVVTMTASYDDWHKAAQTLTAGLTHEDRAKIFGANAAAFYRL